MPSIAAGPPAPILLTAAIGAGQRALDGGHGIGVALDAQFLFDGALELLAIFLAHHFAELVANLVDQRLVAARVAALDAVQLHHEIAPILPGEIGRASCRERVCQYV